MEDLCFYETDEGIKTDVVLRRFGDREVQIIYLESYEIDERFKRDISFIFSNQEIFFNVSSNEIADYTQRKYKNKSTEFELLTIYIFPDTENEFGYLFRCQVDIEHGIGIKFCGTSVEKIGSGEVAFM